MKLDLKQQIMNPQPYQFEFRQSRKNISKVHDKTTLLNRYH